MQVTFSKVSDTILGIRMVSENAIVTEALTRSQIENRIAERQADIDLMQQALTACADLGVVPETQPE